MPDELGRAEGPEWDLAVYRDNAAMAERNKRVLVRDDDRVHVRVRVRVRVQLRLSPGHWWIPMRVDPLLPLLLLRRYLHDVQREERKRAVLHLLLPLLLPLLHLQQLR